jgi:hypothetical protein
MPSELVKQRTNTDCVICCLSMATGISYDSILQAIGPVYQKIVLREGVKEQHDHFILEALGYKMNEEYVRRTYSPHWGTLGFVKNCLWRRRAIINCLSMNQKDMTHAVYWDGEQLLDPSNKKTYKTLEEVEPIDFILFDDKAIEKLKPVEKAKSERIEVIRVEDDTPETQKLLAETNTWPNRSAALHAFVTLCQVLERRLNLARNRKKRRGT